MSLNLLLENYLPSISQARQTKTKLPVVLSGTAATLAVGGTLTVTGTMSTGAQGTGTQTVTSTSASALTVGANGATNPVIKIDASTSSVATGIGITGAAAASGVAVAVISSGTNENLTVNAKGSGVIGIGGTSTGQIAVGRGSVKPPTTSSTIASLGTAQNTTPTGAQLRGGVITQTSATGAGTCTLDTGTAISTATTGVAVGDTFDCVYANLGGGQTVTITGATGSTVIGSAAVATGKNALMKFVNTGTNTWNVYVNVSA